MSARVAVSSEISLKTFDEHTVLYHYGSGDSHLISLDAASLLDLLVPSPAAIDTLTVAMAAALDYQEGDEFSEYIRTLLSDLETLNVVEFI